MAELVVHDAERLKELQALPLEQKVMITQARIVEFVQTMGGVNSVYVSFSGGKDSSVLAHIARQLYPDIQLVFINTGLEYPEVQKHARNKGATFIRPPMRFDQVISTNGYPLIGKEVAEAIYYARRIQIGEPKKENKKRKEMLGKRVFVSKVAGGENEPVAESGCASSKKDLFNKEKYLPICEIPVLISHRCCRLLKKYVMHRWENENKRVPILGTMTEESRMRKQHWINEGCNAFVGKHSKSRPLSFWTDQDVLQYIVKYGVEIPSVYGEIVDDIGCVPEQNMFGDYPKLHCTGCERTGCIFCAFGLHSEKGETRFQRLSRTHPKQYEYALGGGQWVDNPDYNPAAPVMDGEWKNWNPKQIWVPSKKGLGMRKVFDMCNEIYGKDFMRYE